MQVESIGAVGDPGDVILTLEAIEQTRYAEYRYMVLAGRVAAICGLQRLDDMRGSEEGRSKQASAASEALCSSSFGSYNSRSWYVWKKGEHAKRSEVGIDSETVSAACLLPCTGWTLELAACFTSKP